MSLPGSAACKQAFDGNVFVQLGPTDAFTSSDQPPASTPRNRAMRQSRKPCERCGNSPAIAHRAGQERGRCPLTSLAKVLDEGDAAPRAEQSFEAVRANLG